MFLFSRNKENNKIKKFRKEKIKIAEKLMRQLKFDEAKKAITNALEVLPNDFKLLYTRAYICIQTDEFENFLKDIKTLKKISEDNLVINELQKIATEQYITEGIKKLLNDNFADAVDFFFKANILILSDKTKEYKDNKANIMQKLFNDFMVAQEFFEQKHNNENNLFYDLIKKE